MDMNSVDFSKASAMEELKRYKGYLTYDPHNSQLILASIRLAIELHDWDLCASLVAMSKSLPSSSPELSAHFAYFYMLSGDYPQALEEYISAIAGGETSLVVYFNLAQTYFFMAQFERAYETLVDHPDIESELPKEFLLLIARLHHHLGRPNESIVCLERLHREFAGTSESQGLLSLIMFEQEIDSQKARQLADKALAENPDALEALLARSSLALQANDFELAALDLQRASEKYPDNGRVWSSVALSKFNDFQFDEALRASQKSVELMPNHIGTWHLLGWSGIMEQDWNLALHAFQQAYKLDRGFPDTHGGLAAVYAHMGSVKLAEHHIKLADKLSSGGLAAVYAKITLLKMTNQVVEANDLFEKSKHIYSVTLGATLQDLINKRAQGMAQYNA